MEQKDVKLKKLYQLFEARQPDGKWYKEWWVEEDFPDQYMFVSEEPPDGFENPKYIMGTGWAEDDDVLLVSLKKENEDLKERLELVEKFVNKATAE